MIYESVFDLIGNTPMLRLKDFNIDHKIYVKLEKYNVAGSIKDRIILKMIEEKERNKELKKGMTIIEPTSGNTGIALAMIGKQKGYNVIIVMPDTMSEERKSLIRAYGAKLVLTPGKLGIQESIKEAERLVKEKGYVILQQFNNKANPLTHYETTAKEIYRDLPNVDIVVIGVGTGGTISGIGKYLKEKNKNIKIIAVEPDSSAVLSGEDAGKHKIQGIGAGFIPQNFDKNTVDKIVRVTNEEAYKMANFYAKTNGVLIGISSGAAIHATIEILKKELGNKTVVVIAPDGGEKYLSEGIY